MTIWFTADTHFNHGNIIKFCKRPYATVEEMNESLITNWNNVVGNDDNVYHLGDFCFGNHLPIFNELNGNLFIIPGGHDKGLSKSTYGINKNSDIVKRLVLPGLVELEVNIDGVKQLIVMCHYAMRSWNKSHFGSWHLYGHHHGNLPPHGLSFDVGVDTNDFYPYSLEDIENKMKTLSREFIIKEN